MIPPSRRRWFQFSLRTLLAAIALSALLLVAAEYVSFAFFRASNCGGNSAALTACKCFLEVVGAWESDHPNDVFHYSNADLEIRRELTDLPGASWIGSARFLAKLDDVHIDPVGAKRVVIVCDRAYDNVRQRVIWPGRMAHAVGYATGETGLISPEEFARLDTAGFIDLQTLATTDAAK